MSDTLVTMATALPAPRAEAVARVASVTRTDVAETLGDVGFERGDVGDAAAHWDDAREDAALMDVLARVVSAVEAARGVPTAPLSIWADMEDEGPDRRLFYFYVIALCAPGARAYLAGVGVPDDVLASTIASFVRHAALHRESFGSAGIDAGWWQLLALRGELLEIGRLQYHYLVTGESTLVPFPWHDDDEAGRLGPGFRRGDVQFGLHIPDGPGLSPGAIDASLSRAREVLGVVWPTDRRRLATCMSWLLDDHLGEYLDPSSNILAFQRRFTMVPGGFDDDADTLQFVFRRPGAALEDLPQETTLQRAIVARLGAGGHWRARTGWFDFDGS